MSHNRDADLVAHKNYDNEHVNEVNEDKHKNMERQKDIMRQNRNLGNQHMEKPDLHIAQTQARQGEAPLGNMHQEKPDLSTAHNRGVSDIDSNQFFDKGTGIGRQENPVDDERLRNANTHGKASEDKHKNMERQKDIMRQNPNLGNRQMEKPNLHIAQTQARQGEAPLGNMQQEKPDSFGNPQDREVLDANRGSAMKGLDDKKSGLADLDTNADHQKDLQKDLEKGNQPDREAIAQGAGVTGQEKDVQGLDSDLGRHNDFDRGMKPMHGGLNEKKE